MGGKVDERSKASSRHHPGHHAEGPGASQVRAGATHLPFPHSIHFPLQMNDHPINFTRFFSEEK